MAAITPQKNAGQLLLSVIRDAGIPEECVESKTITRQKVGLDVTIPTLVFGELSVKLIQDVTGERMLEIVTGTFKSSTSFKVDREMNVVIPTTTSIVAAGSTTDGAMVGGGEAITEQTGGGPVTVISYGNVTITEHRSIDSTKELQTVTVIPLPAACTPAFAVLGEKMIGTKFPNRPVAYQVGNVAFDAPNAVRVPATARTWWIISPTEPSIALDTMILGPASIIVGGVYVTGNNAIYDEGQGALGMPLTSTPSYTDYMASWYGNQKTIEGDVTATAYQCLWKITTYSVTML